ncbi:phenylacetate--CoA ligase family protein [Sulfitobacter sp. EhC04]|uniref:phenylacetate--CoA ligase family protein n=1 Tax=Sulfitobacter sp. EhC04 TaxID=1849168 RepID=UPI0009EED396|nr:AMP-binding protein [Sulfitobacter sp. EhC04]
MTHPSNRAEVTRRRWKDVLETHADVRNAPVSDRFWSEQDTWSRDHIRAVQDQKVASVAPFLYENSAFYRARFDRLGMAPTDLASVDDLIAKWPVITKQEMMDDVTANPPYGTYTACGDAEWADRGWMLFSSSGTTGVPRVFRYTHFDRQFWEQANARALHSGGLRKGDSALPLVGFGPHVFAWGAQYALAAMGLPVIPGGGLDSKARVDLIQRFNPSTLVCTPSYALYIASVMEDLGIDPAASSVKTLVIGGEAASGVEGTGDRLKNLWGAKIAEFYGCTEVSPHCGGYSCAESQSGGVPFMHLMEDIQIWETVDAETLVPLNEGERGLTVCTNLCSETSPHLRFLVGDYTMLDSTPCPCGRNHLKAMGCMTGRADDLINLRGIKFFPVQIEEAVRSVPGTGDEFQIRLSRTDSGLDTLTVVVEHTDPGAAAQVAAAVRSRCEVRCDVDVVAPKTLPKSEMKAKRVFDERNM